MFGEDPERRHGPGGDGRARRARSAPATAPPPLSARYHLFLRATEGAFTCLSDQGPHVQLARHTDCPDCDAPVFEIGSCKRCGAVHVARHPDTRGRACSGSARARPGARAPGSCSASRTALTDEDEDAVADDGRRRRRRTTPCCAPACGVIGDTPTSASCPGCGADATCARSASSSSAARRSPAAWSAAPAGPARSASSRPASDASGAVIATSLYQNLPPSADAHDGQRPGEGRKLLAFSDSRQAAAYFAPYLEDSYGRLQRRRLIAQGLLAAHADEEPVAIEDVVFTTRAAAHRRSSTSPGG